MSALRLVCTVMWTQLIEAMRADGLIAHCITQSGPATNAVITEWANEALPQEHRGPWIQMGITPRPGREVVAVDREGKLHVLLHDEVDGWYYARQSGRLCVNIHKFRCWTFIDTSGAPK